MYGGCRCEKVEDVGGCRCEKVEVSWHDLAIQDYKTLESPVFRSLRLPVSRYLSLPVTKTHMTLSVAALRCACFDVDYDKQ